MQDNPYHGYGSEETGSIGSLAADILLSPWTLIPWGAGMQLGKGWTAGKLGSNAKDLGYSWRERRNMGRTVNQIMENRRGIRNELASRKRASGAASPIRGKRALRIKKEGLSDKNIKDNRLYRALGGKKRFGSEENFAKRYGIGLDMKGSLRAHKIGRAMKFGGYAMLGAAVIEGIFDYAKKASTTTRAPNGYNMSHTAVHNREAINQRHQAMQLVREMPGWVQRQGSEARRFHS